MPDRPNKPINDLESNRNDIIARLRYLIEQSRTTQGRFAKRIGMDAANFSKVMSGVLKISDSFLNRLVVELGVSKKWLLRGDGTPYEKGADTEPARIEIFEQPVLKAKPTGTPVYDIDVTAGVAELSRMFTDERIVGYIDYPKLDPKNVLVKVSGDSMTPVIQDGALIAIRPVSSTGVLVWGQIYLTVLEDYRLVKYVRRNSDPDKITLHSENSLYDDIELSRKDIVAMYYVDAIFNYKLL